MEFNVENCLKQNDNFACQSNVESVLMKDCKCHLEPKFSIVIPTYKRLETLKEAVNSALLQTYNRLLDVVIVEDNPESDTPIERYVMSLEDNKIRYYKNSQNLGLVGNFNRAVSLAAGEYVVLLHDDDFLFPDYLERMERVVRKYKNADIICPRPVKWHEDKGEARPVQPKGVNLPHIIGYKVWKPLSDWEPFCRNFLPTGVTFKKESFMRTGGFDHLSGPSTDLYYIVRVGQSVNYYMYECPLFVYRWSENESMKFSTRVDFIKAGLPLRRKILEKHRVTKFVSNLLLKNYCAVSQANMKRDFPDKEFNIDGFILPAGGFEAFLAKKTQDILAWYLRLRRIFAKRT